MITAEQHIENMLSLVAEISVILDQLDADEPERFESVRETLGELKEEIEYAA